VNKKLTRKFKQEEKREGWLSLEKKKSRKFLID
jgi:hypothetical protein